MHSEKVSELNVFGFTLLKNVIPMYDILNMRNKLEDLAAVAAEKSLILHSQQEQLILKNIFAQAPEFFLPLLEIESVNQILARVFSDGFTLQSMNASRSNPNLKDDHELRIHVDSRLAIKDPINTLAIGVAVCIDDFTADNGATRVWPFSHLTGLNPNSISRSTLAHVSPTVIEAKAGDIFVFLGHLWHAIGANKTLQPRWGVFSFYNPWWIKPTWDYRDCGEYIFKKLSPFQKGLLGFTSQVPSMNSDRNLTKIRIDDLPINYYDAKKNI